MNVKLNGLKQSPVVLLCIGFFVGIVVAEAVYYILEPVVLPDGSVEVTTDREYFNEVSEVLAGARESIHIVLFSANYQGNYGDSHVNELLQELISARNRGVDVQIVMDYWPEGNDKTVNYLKKNNVEAKMVQIDGTTHAKLIIIDGETVIVGSTNWSYHSVDKNHEANVIIRDGRVAGEFESYFSAVSAEPTFAGAS